MISSILSRLVILTYVNRHTNVNKITSNTVINSAYYFGAPKTIGQDSNCNIEADKCYNRNLYSEQELRDTSDSAKVLDSPPSIMWNLLNMFPQSSFLNVAFAMGIAGVFLRSTVTHVFVYPAFRLVFGTLYPAYASYKAVKTKNVKEYVKWMMYWIVFALFTCTETFTDIFLSWFPFYYEIKIILVIWLLSPATKGSSILYRKFVHPMLSSREQEIDDYISKAKEQSYRQVLDLGHKGVTALMQTAIKGGGGIVNQLKKSYSLSDLSDPTNDANDETDDVIVSDPRLIRRRKPGRSPHRSSSASSASVYFSEVDVASAGVVGGRVSEVRSIEDISSGYSSGEGLYAQHPLKLQARESIASQRTSSLTRVRSVRVTRSTAAKKVSGNSDDSDENEVFDTNIIFPNDKMKKIDKIPEKPESSSSETEFFDIPDSNGFQLHGKIFDNKERTSSSNNNSDRNISYQNENNRLNLSKDYSSSSKPHCIAAVGYGEDSNVTACKSDSSSLSFNLTKLSTALSSLCPPSVASNFKGILSDNVESDISKDKTVTKNTFLTEAIANAEFKESLPESMNLESNYHKPEISKNIQHTNNDLPNANSVKNLSKEVGTNKGATLKSEIPTGSTADNTADEDFKSDIPPVSDNSPNSEVRRGKYKKKLAPLPPLPPKKDKVDFNPIKATLVLQPGIVRNLSRSAESLSKEIFLNYSPKVRRRSRNKSPASSSSRSSDSTASNKMGHALNKMLQLPKRVAHLNIPDRVKEKRNSWGEFFHTKKLENSKVQSRSVSSLDKSSETDNKKEVKSIQRSGSQISIKSLTESPLAHRRLKIIRRYVDNDID